MQRAQHADDRKNQQCQRDLDHAVALQSSEAPWRSTCRASGPSRGVNQNRLAAAISSITANNAIFSINSRPYPVTINLCREPTNIQALTMPVAKTTATMAMPIAEKLCVASRANDAPASGPVTSSHRQQQHQRHQTPDPGRRGDEMEDVGGQMQDSHFTRPSIPRAGPGQRCDQAERQCQRKPARRRKSVVGQPSGQHDGHREAGSPRPGRIASRSSPSTARPAPSPSRTADRSWRPPPTAARPRRTPRRSPDRSRRREASARGIDRLLPNAAASTTTARKTRVPVTIAVAAKCTARMTTRGPSIPAPNQSIGSALRPHWPT